MDKSAKLKGSGARDVLAGKAQRAWGRLTKDRRHELEGEYKIAKGTLKNKTGEALDTIKEIDD